MRIALIISVMTLVTLLSPIAEANTYPPENAVVIYYKIISEYPPVGDDDIMNKIRDYADGEIELDEEIVKHIDKYQYIIKDLTVASDIAYCNWGIDFSEGLETRLPYVGVFKRYTYLLVSDAKRLVSNGDYHEAIDRCITVEKLAFHVGGDLLIMSLVGSHMSRRSDECIMQILSETPVDTDKLLHLRSQLDHFEDRIKRMKDGFLAEKKLLEVLCDKKSPHRITLETLEECEWGESELK